MRSRKNCDSETIFIRLSYCSLCYFEPSYIPLGLKALLLTQFRMYQMYLSSQSTVLAIILNQAIHQRTLNPYQQLISEKDKTTLPFVTIKAFFFVISFSLLCSILLSFALYRFNYFHQFSFETILKHPSYVYHLITQCLFHILLLTQLCEQGSFTNYT